MKGSMLVRAVLAVAVLALAGANAVAAVAPTPEHLGVLHGQLFIANDAHGLQETFGRYQKYAVWSPGGGFGSRLEWRGPGPFREYDVYDRSGQQTGTIEYFGGRYTLRDRAHAPVGTIQGAWAFNGRYQVSDMQGQVVGFLHSPFGDGQSFNVRGDARTVALFARIGIGLGSAPAALPRETVQVLAFGRLHGDDRRAPPPEAGRMHGDESVEGTTVIDTFRRFARYRISAAGQFSGTIVLRDGPGGQRFYEVFDATGVRRGWVVVGPGASTFQLRDAQDRPVGSFARLPGEPAGELHVLDRSGRDVGALVDASGDGGVISIRGGDECAAVFQGIGLKLVPPGAR